MHSIDSESEVEQLPTQRHFTDSKILITKIDAPSKIPKIAKRVGKMLLFVALVFKAWNYTAALVSHITKNTPLSPSLFPDVYDDDDSMITEIHTVVLYTFETIVMYLGPLQLILYGIIDVKWHKIVGNICVGSSIFLSWLGMAYFVLETRIGITARISFFIYWVLVLITSLGTGLTGWNTGSHLEWSIRMYLISMGSFLYKILYMIFDGPHKKETILDIVLNFMFWIPLVILAEVINKVLKNIRGK